MYCRVVSGRLKGRDVQHFCEDNTDARPVNQMPVPGNQQHARTANHDLRAVKTLFKSAREDDVIAEDPAASVKSAHNKAISPTKRPFTLDELRVVLDVADPEWKSMILFGLYTGQRLADVATLRWSNVDLVK